MQYFTYEELTFSETALKKRIRNKTNREIEEHLHDLVEAILDPLRIAYGKPIAVTSGYRCKEVNKAVGGVATSQHLTGCAADIAGATKAETRKIAQLIASSGLPYDQLIDEKSYGWVHVSYSPTGKPRRQILRYDGKKYWNIKASEL